MSRIPVQRASAVPPQPTADASAPEGSLNIVTSGPVSPGTLYLVPMPIGDPEDITLRGLRVLREVSCIAVESLAVARKWMRHWDIATPLLSYGGRVSKLNQAELLSLLMTGRDVAFVCDAGTPGVADPGALVVRAVLEQRLPVTALPGPAAALVALSASGLPTSRFTFDGFPPKDPAERNSFFQNLVDEERAIVLYEYPSRLRATLDALLRALGSERQAALVWDLTKPTETWLRGTLAEIRKRVRSQARGGEITLVVSGLSADTPNAPRENPVLFSV